MLRSSVCTSTQLKSPKLQQWMQRLGHPPLVMHRKLWEWAYIAEALSERDMLNPGRRGLGFAVGKEPLVALFASMGCEIVATDLDEATANAVGWTETNQHSRDLSTLNEAQLCATAEFAQRVSFRTVDMNEVPDDLTGYDFVWSSCAIEHLGDINSTEEFLSRAMDCLRPGGIAVHTTEYNLTSDTDTIEHGATVILRKSDIERMTGRLRDEGHLVEPVEFDIGNAPDDQVILHPPYEGQPCLKIWLGPHAATSIGLIAKAGANAGKSYKRRHLRRSPDSAQMSQSAGFLRRMHAWLGPKLLEGAASLPGDRHGSSLATSRYANLDDVRHAYRLLLGRAPDAAGFEHHRRTIKSGTVTTRALADQILGSEEFRNGRAHENDPLEVTFDGYSLFVRSNDRDIGAQILRTKTYEPHVTSVLRGLLRAGDTFVDVGANVGYFMALAAHMVGPAGQVVAVEPMDKNLQLLYATVWRNGFRNVEIHPFAASDKKGVLAMATGPGTSNGQVMVDTNEKRLPMMFAQTWPLDDMLASLDELHVLKIDIEGHELVALRGFAKGLTRHRPRIISEFHPKCMRENSRIDPADYLDFLFAYSGSVLALHSDSTQVECHHAADVMREWRTADARLISHGTTHIDLLVCPRA